MFGLRRRPAGGPPVGTENVPPSSGDAVPAPVGPRPAPSRFANVGGAVALPDDQTNARMATLTATIGASLQGRAGLAYNYDRGDPTRSLTGPINGVTPPPASAIARVYASADSSPKPTPVFQDGVSNDPALDPYMAAAWSRMVTR